MKHIKTYDIDRTGRKYDEENNENFQGEMKLFENLYTFEELDTIIASENITDNIPINTIGTIVLQHKFGNAYEVEFFDNDNNTIDVVTVKGEQIKLRDTSEQKSLENKNVDITANIKSNSIKNVEQFFNDVKQSYNKIVDEDDDNDLDKTGRSYDEDNEKDEELIVQDDETKLKTFDEYIQRTSEFVPNNEELGKPGELRTKQKSFDHIDNIDIKAHKEIQKLWETVGELSKETEKLSKYMLQNKKR